jgi:hypothetical protein
MIIKNHKIYKMLHYFLYKLHNPLKWSFKQNSLSLFTLWLCPSFWCTDTYSPSYLFLVSNYRGIIIHCTTIKGNYLKRSFLNLWRCIHYTLLEHNLNKKKTFIKLFLRGRIIVENLVLDFCFLKHCDVIA